MILLAHIFWPVEYLGMSGKTAAKKHLEVFSMYNNGFCGGNLCWIIILLILFCGCGNNQSNNGCCDNNCCC